MFQKDKLDDLLDAPVSKPDPFTLASVIAWLETMPPEVSYQWECTDGGCMIGQYSTAQGSHLRYYHEQCDAFGADELIVACVASNRPRTFGAALIRARAYAAQEVGK